MLSDPLTLHERVLDSYIRYYETLFALRHDRLDEERRERLLEDGAICRAPWIEPIAKFKSAGRTLSESCEIAGASGDLARMLESSGVFDPSWSLYDHQEKSLEAVCSGKNIAVTAGTGSGKTESVFFPIFNTLLEESVSWAPVDGSASSSAWWNENGKWEPQRTDREARKPAVRALVLYPMNALVEDQMQRLRVSLDSDNSRDWMDEHRGGNRFYFGRYTGRTPVAGSRTSPTKRKKDDLRKYMRDMEDGYGRAPLSHREFFQNPFGAEMRSRWDMQVSPPDILVTNYSMLNVMLQRDDESRIFESTREWLEADPSHKFTIAIDELHVYRGTAGTEVALLLRTLLHRLGLGDRADRVRFLAASASAGNSVEEYRSFLGQFFGVDDTTVEIVGAESHKPVIEFREVRESREMLANLGNALSRDVEKVAEELGKLAGREVGSDLEGCAAEVGTKLRLDEILRAACWDDDNGSARARSATELASTVFDADENSESALKGLLWLMQAGYPSRDDAGSVREHLFFQNVLGFWACSDPECAVVPDKFRFENRPIGRIYRQPRVVCDCGSRVLDLLRCQTCNEVFLGGYRAKDPESSVDSFLLPDYPELDQLPEFEAADRSAASYAIYWPTPDGHTKPLHEKPWKRGDTRNSFKAARFDPASGRLARPGESGNSTGWRLSVEGDESDAPAIPRYCPHCDDSWERAAMGDVASDPGRSPSPIRFLRTGFEKVTQVLSDALIQEVAQTPEQRKLVVFTDSRQDAAKLAAAIEFRHHEDLIRGSLAAQALKAKETVASDFSGYESVLSGSKDPEDLEKFKRFRESNREMANIASDLFAGLPVSDDDKALFEQFKTRVKIGSVRLQDIRSNIEHVLLQLGVTPTGKFRLRTTRSIGGIERSWHSLFDFNAGEVAVRKGLSSEESDWLEELRESLLIEILYVVFAGRRRDFESVGLGRLTIDPAFKIPEDSVLDTQALREVSNSAIRVLGNARRFIGGRKGKEDASAPADFKKYMKFVAETKGVDSGQLSETVEAVLTASKSVRQWLIDPLHTYVDPDGSSEYSCVRCGQLSLHASAEVCIHCGGKVEVQGEAAERMRNYYAPQFEEGEEPFRLNTEELTGQTDPLDAQERQAAFQGIMLDSDAPKLACEIDLLSVTTTMEVGVDIGSLQAVVMGNMPPMRFNYQQRVGRAGRRETPLSVALTVARGRSHDEHYFRHPEQITGDPPKPPYIDLERLPIFKRTLLADSLRQAFATVRNQLKEIDFGYNVHGQFGKIADWATVRPHIGRELIAHRESTRETAVSLAVAASDEVRRQVIELADWIADAAVKEIDQAIDSGAADTDDLSEFLAGRGLLPMFGFPSRVKLLYTRRPSSFPPRHVIDREDSIAISQWAPGSDVVKDKMIHKVAGIANYMPEGGIVKSDPDPLGPRIKYHYCRACGGLDPSDLVRLKCSICGESDPKLFRQIDAIEPLGYRTDFRPTPYRDWFDWTSSGTQPRFADERELELSKLGSLQIRHGTARMVQINDNGGHDYLFEPTTEVGKQGGWIVRDALNEFESRNIATTPAAGRSVALSSSKLTDVLLIGIDEDDAPEGLSMGTLTPAGKGAWYSLGFLLRGAASRLLEVQTDELDIGIRPLLRANKPWAEVFLADSLANGAGYCSHLGEREVFQSLMEAAQVLVAEFDTEKHAANCDSSCYDCLRDFRNMRFHGLLDWRLAADMIDVLLGEFEPNKRWAGLTDVGLNILESQFDGEPISIEGQPGLLFDWEGGDDSVIIALHPLMSADRKRPSELQKAIRKEITSRYGARTNFRPTHGFDLIRRATWVYADSM